MGSRRLGRRRMYSLLKYGEKLTSTAGAGIEGNIGHQTRLRDGELITTDITIDLASSNGAAYSFPTKAGTANDMIIGVSSSTSTSGSNGLWTGNENAHIMLINATASAADGIGVLTSGELMCVESPTGGGVTIGLALGTNASGSGADMGIGGLELIQPVSQFLGVNSTFDLDSNRDNYYMYLIHSGSGDAAYTAGKFVLRLYGWNVFDDV